MKEPTRGILMYASPNPPTVVFEEPEDVPLRTREPGSISSSSSGSAGPVEDHQPSRMENESANPKMPDELNTSKAEQSPWHMKKVDEQHHPKTSALHPDSAEVNTRGDSKVEKALVPSTFHVFTWLNTQQPTSLTTDPEKTGPDKEPHPAEASPKFDEASMREDLNEIDNFLQHKLGFQERVLYRECRESSRKEIYAILEARLAHMNDQGIDYDPMQRKVYEDQVEVVNKAETMLQVFLPSDYDGPTVGKFWGALRRLFEVSWIVHFHHSFPPGPRPAKSLREVRFGQ